MTDILVLNLKPYHKLLFTITEQIKSSMSVQEMSYSKEFGLDSQNSNIQQTN